MEIEKLLIEAMPHRYALLTLVHTLSRLEPPLETMEDKSGTKASRYNEQAIYELAFRCVKHFNATHGEQIMYEEFMEELIDLQHYLNEKALRTSQLPT